jgi:hypothetical protein
LGGGMGGAVVLCIVPGDLAPGSHCPRNGRESRWDNVPHGSARTIPVKLTLGVPTTQRHSLLQSSPITERNRRISNTEPQNTEVYALPRSKKFSECPYRFSRTVASKSRPLSCLALNFIIRRSLRATPKRFGEGGFDILRFFFNQPSPRNGRESRWDNVPHGSARGILKMDGSISPT